MTQQVVASNVGGIFDTTNCCIKYGRNWRHNKLLRRIWEEFTTQQIVVASNMAHILIDKQAFVFPYGTALYCTVLYCTVLYCTVLYCMLLYCTVLYYTVLYYNVLYSNVLYYRYKGQCICTWTHELRIYGGGAWAILRSGEGGARPIPRWGEGVAHHIKSQVNLIQNRAKVG